MLHTSLIVLHASFAVAGFVFGCLVMATLPASSRSGRFVSFDALIDAAMVCLIAVVVLDWSTLTVTKRIAFGILSLLAVYLIIRVEQARRSLARQRPGWRKAFLGHVGFVMISLFDGFCIVAAIDLRMPPAVIVVVAVLGVAVGIWVIRRLVRREVTREAASV
ncbi:hypothetical protein ACPPVQ_12605 [Diaminobutyricibacter sp. McL0618]|uniref:hypothetical protein n=1 Tax=Leifsonia sp. McL0618 TaxID=3415677 RepID=UPI003CF57446